jgi:hypothetical protein
MEDFQIDIVVGKGPAASSIDDEDKLIARLFRGLERDHPLKSFLKDASFTSEQKADVISQYLNTEKASTRSRILADPEYYTKTKTAKLGQQVSKAAKAVFNKDIYKAAYKKIYDSLNPFLPQVMPRELIPLKDDMIQIAKTMPKDGGIEYIQKQLTGGLKEDGTFKAPYKSVKNLSRQELNQKMTEVIETNKKIFRSVNIIINKLNPLLDDFLEIVKSGKQGAIEKGLALIKFIFDNLFLSGFISFKEGRLSAKWFAIRFGIPFSWTFLANAFNKIENFVSGFLQLNNEVNEKAKEKEMELPDRELAEASLVRDYASWWIEHTSAAGLLGLGISKLSVALAKEKGQKPYEKSDPTAQAAAKTSGAQTRQNVSKSVDKAKEAVKELPDKAKEIASDPSKLLPKKPNVYRVSL